MRPLTRSSSHGNCADFSLRLTARSAAFMDSPVNVCPAKLKRAKAGSSWRFSASATKARPRSGR
jgi:hypothetical protein